jgi:hypothetical protein
VVKKQYWFTVNANDLRTMQTVEMNMEYEFGIRTKKYGTGEYVTIEADFYVMTPVKRTSIKKYLEKYFPGVIFRSYPVVK